MAVQNTRKNLAALSVRLMWMISWRRISRRSSAVYVRSGSTTRMDREKRPTLSGVDTAGEISRGRRTFLHPALCCSSCHSARSPGSSTGRALLSNARRKRRWSAIFHPSTAQKPVAHTAPTQITGTGRDTTHRGSDRSMQG